MQMFDKFRSIKSTSIKLPATKEKDIVPQIGSHRIPPDIFDLLWFEDGPYKNLFVHNENRVEIEGFVLEFSISESSDPSAISMKEQICEPSENKKIPELGYYPSYYVMSPEQRWQYLEWLTNIDLDIDIGYVFVFYYGLERHLFLGKYESAFNTILRLRTHHKNSSFIFYSSHALVASCILHRRPDLFLKYLESLKHSEDLSISNLYLLAKYAMQIDLVSEELVLLANTVGFKNKHYLKNESQVFISELKKLLLDKYGKNSMPLSHFPLKEWPKENECLAANMSFLDDYRASEVPSLKEYPKFKNTVLTLLEEAHKNTKEILRASRSSKISMILPTAEQQDVAKKPSKIFNKSELFDQIDTTIFDKNIAYYKKGICPNCNNILKSRSKTKIKCSYCGETVYVKNNIFTGQKVLLTYEELQRMEDIKNERVRRNWIVKVIQSNGFSIEELLESRKRSGKDYEEILLELLEKTIVIHKLKGDMGLCRNSIMYLGRVNEKLGNKRKALELYLNTCFYDINGPVNCSSSFVLESGIAISFAERFDAKSFLSFAPAVLNWIEKLGRELGMTMSQIEDLFKKSSKRCIEPGMTVSPSQAWNALSEWLNDT